MIPQLDQRSAVEWNLKLAEEVLDISNRNIQLTTEILIRGSRDVEPLLKEQFDNTTRIQLLVQKIREQLESDRERVLLDAAGARWTSSNRHLQGVRAATNGQKPVEARGASVDVMLPLLLDNSSWRAFVQFLRTQSELAGIDEEFTEEMAGRTRELVRANRELKSKIAERKRVEERLSQLGSIIDSSSDAIIIHALDGMMVSWNAGAESLYGYPRSEVLGKSRNLLIAPDQPDELRRIADVVQRGEGVEVFEAVHLHKDGRRIDVSTAVSPVKDADGKILGAAAITRNISDRKNAEERFYKAFNANPEPITIASLADGRYIDVNESFLRITGCRREEVIGRTSLELKFWERAEDRAGLVKTLQEHGSVRDLEITFLTKSGEQRIGSNSAEIIEIGGEKCVISIFRDMTEQRILEKKLLRA